MGLDNINNKKVHLQKFNAGLHAQDLKTKKEDEAKMKALFRSMDKDHNGVVDREELGRFLNGEGDTKGIDRNGDGTISRSEARKFLKAHKEDLKSLGIDKKDLIALLNQMGDESANIESFTGDKENGFSITYKNNEGNTPAQRTVDTKGSYTNYDNSGNTQTFDVDNNLLQTIETDKTTNTKTTTNYAGENISEQIIENDESTSITQFENGLKTETTITNKSDNSQTKIDYENGLKTKSVTTGTGYTSTIEYDSNGEPKSKVTTRGTTEQTFAYENGNEVLKKSVENKGLDGKEITKVYDSEGGYTQTKNVVNGKITTIVDKDGNVTSNVKTETINGQEVSLELDADGNIPGVIVQNGESPAAIAKAFGCSVDELLELNADQLKGKGKNQYFSVGAEIKLPNSVSIERFMQASENRKPAEVVKAEYARDAEIRRQKAEAARQEQEYYQSLGVKSFNNKGKKIKAEFSGGKQVDVEIIGQMGYGRQLVKYGDKICTISHDNKILREDYLQAHKAFVSKSQEQRNNTASGIQDVTYVKDNNGNVWYFDEKTGKAIIKDGYKQIVEKESTFVANQLHKAAKGMGTDEELLAQGVKNIYSRDILQGVNEELKTKDSDYAGDSQTMPVEALILDEMSHTSARPLLKTLINSGTMTIQEQAHTVKREIEYEVHGGLTGYTSTSDLNEIMQLCSDRDLRLEVEAQFKKDHPELAEDEGSVVRSYIAGDGWNAQEVDQFDANWIKTGAYQEARYVYAIDENGNILFDETTGKPLITIDEGDQAHRNGVIERLVFDYQDKEALNKGLDAMNDDDDSFDQLYFLQRAEQEIEADPDKYIERFTEQDPRQRYIAGFHSDSSGKVDAGEVSASNTLLFKGVKPARIQAEEALYNVQNGDYDKTFDSMDTETYAQMAELIANGDVEGISNMTDLYNIALNDATTPNDKTKIMANAILSGQLKDNFTDEQIADFCIELMHTIDNNRGLGGSTGASAGFTNDADYQTEQLKAILQNNPQVMDAVKARVEKENFSYTTTIQTGGGPGQQPVVTSYTTDTKNKYEQLLADTKTISNEEIFLDAEGNQITDETQIQVIKNANMQALTEMRKYVAELERDFKKGVDAEGALSDAGNAVLKYSGFGTDREDVANEYRQAKLMLQQFEAAAQGKLRDNEGNVISAQDLAQQMLDKQNALAETNNDYKQSVAYAKMGIIMAPVILVTTVASGGAAAAGWSTVGIAATGGIAAGGTTYTLNAVEYNTSYTGNTAEAREHNLQESLVNGVSTAVGIGQMKYIGQMANNMGTVARTGIRLGTAVTADTAIGAGSEYVLTRDVTGKGVAMATVGSLIGNGLTAKSLGAKTSVKPQGAKSEGVYGSTFKRQDTVGTNPGISHNGKVHVGKKKAGDITDKTNQLVANSKDGAELARAFNELDGLKNSGLRRANQQKIQKAVENLPPEQRKIFEQAVKEHHQVETSHVFERNNEFSGADGRTMNNAINDAQTPQDLIKLREQLKTKEYTQGGATSDYAAFEAKIDKKLTEMIRNSGADELDQITKQLNEMKANVTNDARLTSSLENISKEIASRRAFLNDQAGAVKNLLTNGKGFADNSELDKIVAYIKTLDSEQALNEINILRRSKKMTGAQKKILDQAIENQSKAIKKAPASTPASEPTAAPKTKPTETSEPAPTPTAKPVETPPRTGTSKDSKSHFDGIDDKQLVEDYNKINKEWQKLRNSGEASTTTQSIRERRSAYIEEIRSRGIRVEDDGFGNYVIAQKRPTCSDEVKQGFSAETQELLMDNIKPGEKLNAIKNGYSYEITNENGTLKITKTTKVETASNPASKDFNNYEKTLTENGFETESAIIGGYVNERIYVNKQTGEKIKVNIDKDGNITTEQLQPPKTQPAPNPTARPAETPAVSKYSKDYNGNILPENYGNMTQEELLAEYQNLRNYESDGRIYNMGTTPSGRIITRNSHDMSTNKTQIREILKNKYGVDRNGKPLTTQPKTEPAPTPTVRPAETPAAPNPASKDFNNFEKTLAENGFETESAIIGGYVNERIYVNKQTGEKIKVNIDKEGKITTEQLQPPKTQQEP